MRRRGTLSQAELASELREAIDAVRIADPLRGPSPAARKRLRRLIRENHAAIDTIHIHHNVGRVRMEWVAPLIAAELEP